MRCLRTVLLAFASLGLLPGLAPAQAPAASSADDLSQNVIGGAALYLVTPYFANNPAWIVNDKVNKQAQVHSTSRQDIDHDLQVAPLFWLGYITDCGLGGRARYGFLNSD